jgi:predicted RNA binding protein YcfA (HicA-like mRNA interferase family)
MAEWTFITNHGLILASIAKDPERTARETGDEIGVTERTAHKIIKDLEKDGYITKTKIGRHNTYRVHTDVPIKSGDAAVGDLLMMLGSNRRGRQTKTKTPKTTVD